MKTMFAALEVIRAISEELDAPMSHVALSWLLHQPSVTSVVAGARNPQQVQENAQAATLRLSPDVLGQLNTATHDVRAKLGANADMWLSESRYR
jgi:aryl-alcohol dehydrogenase-like predicted oxidoreductase